MVKHLDLTSKIRRALAGPVPSQRRPSKENSTNAFSLLFFSWPWAVIRSAGFRRLELTDFPLLNPNRTCESMHARIRHQWHRAIKSGSKRPLLRALERSCRFDLWLGAFLDVLGTALDFSRIVILYFFYQYLRQSQRDRELGQPPPSYARGIIWVGSITGLHMVISLLKTHAHYRLQIMGAEVRTALICCITDKSFTVLPDAPCRAKHADPSDNPVWNTSAVTSLLNVHCDRISLFFTSTVIMARIILCFPIILGIFIWLLHWIAAPAFASIFLCLAVAFYVARILVLARRQANTASEKRVNEMTGVLKGIRLVKFFAWEGFFLKRICELRRVENNANQRVAALWATSGLSTASVLLFAPLVAYALYASQYGLDGSPSIVLTGVTYMTLDRHFWEILNASLNTINSWTALELVEDFLKADDANDSVETSTCSSGVAVSVSSALFSWSSKYSSTVDEMSSEKSNQEPQPVSNTVPGDDSFEVSRSPSTNSIRDTEKAALATVKQTSSTNDTVFSLAPLSFELKSGELVAIVGPLQSGKSSLLRGLVGEMHLLHGSFSLDGRPAYCPQEPWIQSATVKDNIIFGQRFDAGVYASTLAACALQHDLDRLPRGDLSRLGERGVNISGGQKARIHLARVLYQTLVRYLAVVLLDDPLSAVDARTCSTLFDQAISTLLKYRCRILITNQLHVLPKCDRVIYMKGGQIVADGTFDTLMKSDDFATFVGQHGGMAVEMPWEGTPNSAKAIADQDAAPREDEDDQIIDDEERAAYKVPWRLYLRFCPDPRTKMALIGIFILLVLSQAIYITICLDTAWWTADTWNLTLAENIVLYLALCLGQSFIWLGYTAGFQVFVIRQVRKFSDGALEGMLKAPLSFFQANPEGRILQRFTHDIALLDAEFPGNAWLFGLASMFTAANCVVAIYYIPIVAALLCLWVVYGYTTYFLYKATPLETKRLSINLSSVYQALLQEGLVGRTTIKLASYTKSFQDTIFASIDDHNGVHFMSFAAFEWASLVNNFAFDVILFGTGLLLLRERFANSPAIEVFVMSIFLAASGLTQCILTAGSECQKAINAVERLTHFEHKLPREVAVPKESREEKPWLLEGAIEFRNVNFRYKERLPLALKDISMRIEPREKVGIVGRTGAGKSSLLMALLRLVPLKDSKVYIDGTDTATVGLSELRHAIATIPQDPVLFVGTIRFNLDPTGEIPDDRLLAALEQVHLAGPNAMVRALTLDHDVKSGGSNFSSGERQLISLARALAKQSKIIVIDEATSNVDMATDFLVQKTIRRVFADCTVLTIAHRLRTVMYYDRICVMDQGRVVEIAPPRDLYQRQGGYFHALCVQAGISLEDFASEEQGSA